MFTDQQIAAVKYMVFKAKNGTELSKRILAFLIDQSEGFTKEVCLTLRDNYEGYTGEEIDKAARGIHAMQSCLGTTHIDQILLVLGSQLQFSFHYGAFDNNMVGRQFSAAGQFVGMSSPPVVDTELLKENMSLRYTFWLAKEFFSRHANMCVTSRSELEQINLQKPGLYSHEPA